MPTLTKAQWRKKFLADDLQKKNHQYRMRIEEGAAHSYVSTTIDTSTANEKIHALKLPSTNSLEQQWENLMNEQMQELNSMEKY